MPSSATFAIPYPALTDTPDVPYWQQQQADAVDAALKTVVVALTSDATYPKAAAAVTAEFIVDKFTIASVAYNRRLTLATSVYCVATAASQADLICYAALGGGAATAIAYSRTSLGVSTPSPLVLTTKLDIAAGQSAVIDLRVARFSGTGTLTTSVASGFTNTNILLIRR